MAALTGNSVASTYKDLLQVSNSNAGVDATLRTVDDGEGTASALSISSAAIQVDNLKLDGNTITSEDTNGNITLTPNGTGDTILNGDVLIGNAGGNENSIGHASYNNPSQRVEINGTWRDPQHGESGNAGDTGAIFRLAGGGHSNALDMGVFETSPYSAWIQGTNRNTSDSDAGVYPLILQPSGNNVGIGTASPDANTKLDVAGVIRASGGIQPNGNAYSASEVLDDYEEGTWSPQYTDLTNNGTMHSDNYGIYTKVGNVVTIGFRARGSALNSMTGQIYISELPFTPESIGGVNKAAGGSVSYYALLAIPANTVPLIRINNGDTNMQVTLTGSTTGTGSFVDTNLTDSGLLAGSFTYITA